MLNIDTLPIYVALIALILIKGAAFAPTTSKEWTGTTYSSALAASTEPAPSFSSVARKFVQTAVPGPPLESKPDYENIVGPLGRFMDQIFMKVFRKQLAEQVGADSVYDDYRAIIDLASQMNRQIANRTEIHQRAEQVLINLFPSWMPSSYAVLFSKPFPAFSSRMNAWATWVGGTWLMGECEINTVPVDGGVEGVRQGLLVKRCRFLEESGCASVCVNSCKIPTQNFFANQMGLPLTMEPDYETYECQFSFGRTPDATTEQVATQTPCLARCPTMGSLRQFHNNTSEDANDAVATRLTTKLDDNNSQCPYMEK